MPRVRSHAPDCACCSPAPAQQSLEELEFSRSICNYASLGDLQKVQAILKKSPQAVHGDGTPTNASGYTALHYAARGGHLAVVRVLLDAGAAVNAATAAGLATPLHRAAFCGHAAVVDALLAAGALPELQDADGQTALHKARQGGHAAVAAALETRRPDLAAVLDNRGRRASDLAPSS
jgi:ankyrin repeat protein